MGLTEADTLKSLNLKGDQHVRNMAVKFIIVRDEEAKPTKTEQRDEVAFLLKLPTPRAAEDPSEA